MPWNPKVPDKFIRQEILPRTPIGGGEGYVPSDPITAEDADVVVRTGDELADALDGRTEGVVFVPDGVDIDLAGLTLDIRGETTLAGALADNGERRSTLFTRRKGADSHAWAGGGGTGVFHLYDDASMQQLRLIGPHIDHFDNPRFPGYIPFPDGDTYEERKGTYSDNRARGIKAHSGVTLENMEIAGWGQQGVYLGDRNTHAGTVTARYIDGHDCMMTSAGYVFDVGRGMLVLSDSYLNAARHVICAFGYKDCSYRITNTLVGPSHSQHMFDMHRVGNNLSDSAAQTEDPEAADWRYRAGGTIELERVTTVATHIPPESEGINFDAGSETSVAFIRGVPYDQFHAERCHVAHADPEGAFAQSSVPDDMADENGFCNMTWADNKYGLGEHYPGYGADINLENPRDGTPLIPAETRAEYRAGVEKIMNTFGGQ